MKMLTDDELIKELEGRFAFNQKALTDLQEMTKKLESMNAKLQDSETVKVISSRIFVTRSITP